MLLNSVLVYSVWNVNSRPLDPHQSIIYDQCSRGVSPFLSPHPPTHPLVSLARKPVTATSDVQLSAMRSRIAELKAQIKGGGGDRDSTGSLGVSKLQEVHGGLVVDLDHGFFG